MNIKTILDAMDVLDRAGSALRNGDVDISGQMRLGFECTAAQITLKLALQRDFPEVKIVEEVES